MKKMMVLGVLLMVLLTEVRSQTAKGQYTMNKIEDCSYAGYLEVPDGLNVYINGRSLTQSSGVLSCTLSFKATDNDAQLLMTFDSYTINDCDVTLTVTARDSPDKIQTFKCSTPMPGEILATSGQAVIKLDRRNIDDMDYNYLILVRSYKPDQVFEEENPPDVDVALIAGVVAGVVVLLVLIAIICVCCYRKRHQMKAPNDAECKMNLEERGQESHGYSNEMLRNGNTPLEYDSPRSQKKLLGGRNDKVHSTSVYAPESKKTPLIDPDETALQGTVFKFDRNAKPVNERSVDRPAKLTIPPAKAKETHEAPQSPTSPILEALHNNPKFRKSFQTNQADAEKRANRISDHMSESMGSQSSVPESPPPPPLPTAKKVPKSPKPLRHHASIRRAYRQSSSNEDIDDLVDSEYHDRNIKLIKGNDEPPSPSEIVPIKLSDPHAAAEGKPKHTLRPNRGKSPSAERKKNQKRGEEETTVRDKDPAPSDSGFKRNNSLRKKSTKSPRLGRSARGSRDTELEDFDSVSRPGTPTSIVSGFRRDEDAESYSPLRRTDSRQSLYASRSSLYGRRSRRERRNSFGESVSTYARDDLDTSMYSAFSERPMSKRRYDRGFRSMGDIVDPDIIDRREKETQTLQESSTQTGKGQAVIAQPKKYVRNQSMRKKSTSGASSNNAKEASSKAKQNGIKVKEKEKAKEAKESKDAETGAAGVGSEAPTTPKMKPKPKPKPKPVPRKGHSKSTSQVDETSTEAGQEAATTQPTAVAGSTLTQNVVPPGIGQPGMMAPPGMYMQPYYPPGASVPQGYYPVAAGMMPNSYAQNQPIHMIPPQQSATLPPQQVASPIPTHAQPAGQSKSSWDLLCEITQHEKQHGPSMSDATSVTGSVFSSRLPSQGYPVYNGGYPTVAYTPAPVDGYVPSVNGRFTPAETSSGHFLPANRGSPDEGSVSVISSGSSVSGNVRKDSWGALKDLVERSSPNNTGSHSKQESIV